LGREEQSNPHVPQFLGSVCVSTHRESHRFGVGAPQLGTQTNGEDDAWQRGAVAGQALVQLPQVRASVRFASQPSFGRSEQCAYPKMQALGGTTHVPERHWTSVAPDLTLGRVVQSRPQAPQWCGSDFKSTHCDPHASGDEAGHTDEQSGAPPIVEQKLVGGAHFLSHRPQWSGSVTSVSQPSSGLLEQWANPDLQADAGT
jgi:hypothetical protein